MSKGLLSRCVGWTIWGSVTLTLVAGGCATSATPPADSSDGGSMAHDSPTGGTDAMLFGDVNDDTSFSVDAGCAAATYQAQFLPAAMLVVLDGSGEMAQSNKYAFAEQAIVNAINETAFDSMYLGLLIYPTGNVTGPACVFNLPVACAVPGLAQVQLQLAGTSLTTDPTGVRHDIYAQLETSSPNTSGVGEGNPAYDAIQSGIGVLQGWPMTGKRILFYITDGGASCASLSTRGGYTDGNGCPDWEYPSSIISLVQAANQNATTPVNTIFVGVPGADTDGQNANVPPYSVRLALSAEAWAGSPQTCDPTCDGMTFTQTGADPVIPCHFDMTQNYSPTILANAINQIRGSLLGCTFAVPQPEGGMVDLTKVNVEYSVDGMAPVTLPKRASPSNPCTTGNGCWDYDSSGQIELYGAACAAVDGMSEDGGESNGQTTNVQIVVGCQTITQ
jgi:hypothetical protein